MHQAVKDGNQPGRRQVGAEDAFGAATIDERGHTSEQAVVCGADVLGGKCLLGGCEERPRIGGERPGTRDQAAEGLAWITGQVDPVEGLLRVGECTSHHLRDEIGAGGEVAVERDAADAGGSGDLPDARVRVAAQDGPGGVEDRFDVPFGVRAPLGPGRRLVGCHRVLLLSNSGVQVTLVNNSNTTVQLKGSAMTSSGTRAGAIPVDHPAKGSALVRSVLRRWPSFVGVAAAVFLLAGGTDFPAVLTGAALVYLGAALLGRRGSAWPLFLGTVVALVAAQLVADALGVPLEVTVLMLALGVAGALYAAVRTPAGRAMIVGPSAVAMLGFGAIGVVAVLATPVVGGVIVGLGLLGHAAWDYRHFRRNTVVSRSLAEFCGVLDTLLGVAVVVLAVTGALS